jgi:hypothetical protein
MNIVSDEIYDLSEKEINLSKDNNSLIIKSIEETEFNFIDLIKDKLYISIMLTNNNSSVQLSYKSILKIFNILTDTKIGENLESNLTDYITCTVFEDDTSFHKEITANSIGVLDTPFKKVLDQTKKYLISFVSTNIDEMKKELLNFDNKNNKIIIESKSIEKICKYLNKNIYDISDFINILVLYNNDNEFDKDIIKRKLIDKYDKIGQNIYFMGVKNLDTDLKIAKKNDKNPIYRYNNLFDHIWNKIENIENNYSSSDENSEHNHKTDNNSDVLNNIKNIKSEIDNFNKNNDNEEYKITDEIEKKDGCHKDFCPKCIIF